MKEKIFLIDSGHGGFINGVYQTDPAKGKKFTFPNGETAYEGQINRLIKAIVMQRLAEEGFMALDVCPTELDLSLDARCDIVNRFCLEFGSDKCLLLSLHSNAGGGNGFEIFTAPGQSKSDLYATIYFATFKQHFPNIKLRADNSDGDPDKESKFYILIHTRCPAILPEFLFYDRWEDWQILKNPQTHKLYAEMIVDFAKRVTTKI